LADWILERALEHRTGERPELDPLPDELEDSAHAVAADRARARGGRY
jgi:CobQ-like glutamine amidotransferase family enzyme